MSYIVAVINNIALHTLNLFKRQISGFPDGSVIKNPPANAGATGDSGLILGQGRSPGGGKSNPLQYMEQKRAGQNRVHTPNFFFLKVDLKHQHLKKKKGRGLLWWLSCKYVHVKPNAGSRGLIPGLGRSHMPRSS